MPMQVREQKLAVLFMSFNSSWTLSQLKETLGSGCISEYFSLYLKKKKKKTLFDASHNKSSFIACGFIFFS